MTTVSLDEMTWEEIRDAAGRGTPVVVAVGATEQHGPHLPVCTDWVIPEALERAAAQRIPLVVGPPLRLGAKSRPLSGGGEHFPGTISLRAATLIEVLAQTLGGLVRSGFTRLVVHNWHLENAGHLWEACDLVHERYPEATMLLIEDPFPALTDADLEEIFPNGFPGWRSEHASVVETSLMQVVRPDLVRFDRIIDDHGERAPAWDVIPYPPAFTTSSGVLSRATDANEETGRLLFERAVGHLVDAVTTEFGARAE